MNNLFQKISSMILYSLLFVFPFFFLNITQEYSATNKIYLLAFVGLILLLIFTIQLLISKKITWEKKPFDLPILIFLGAIITSIVVSSPNKIQALFNLNFGFIMILSLVVLYFFLSRSQLNERVGHDRPLKLISIILSLITIIFYFQPFKNITLPQNLIFLKSPTFSPGGSQLDLMVLLGFFVVFEISQIFKKGRPQGVAPTGYLILNLLALFLTLYTIFRPIQLNATDPSRLQMAFPPLHLSWLAAIEVLKNFRTALFGIGLDNFGSVFTRVKDFAYNQSSLWEINSFNVSRSAILQILTETGIFGLATFGFLIFSVFKQLVKGGHGGPPLQLILFIYLLICLLIFPSSLIIWFLLFVTLAQLSRTDVINQVFTIDLTDLPFVYFGIAVVSFLLIGVSGYFLGRAYSAEYYFKKSIDSLNKNDAKNTYDNMRRARLLNPYDERFILNFAQTNLVIANNLVGKKTAVSKSDREMIAQAIQASISEAKELIRLNPYKAQYYENLANIYKNITAITHGADVWVISSYQRAIALDPTNPIYRLELGGTYYLLGKYNDATKVFEQTISLKPNWANAYYNLAWAYYKNAEYDKATFSMQNVVKLIDKKTDLNGWNLANRDLENFKNKLATESSLNLPNNRNKNN